MKKKHIFLTGNVQVGKTTLIRNVLNELPMCRLGGFCTISVMDTSDAFGSVYIVKADAVFAADGNNVSFTKENRVGIRSNEGPLGFPEVFEQYGVNTLSDAGTCDLILMDEVGKMERNALTFTNLILEVLEGDVPVFGVLRKEGTTPIQEAIRNHPNVRLIEVTAKNRDQLLPELVRYFSEWQPSSAS